MGYPDRLGRSAADGTLTSDAPFRFSLIWYYKNAHSFDFVKPGYESAWANVEAGRAHVISPSEDSRLEEEKGIDRWKDKPPPAYEVGVSAREVIRIPMWRDGPRTAPSSAPQPTTTPFSQP